jgi:hypothetical protein
MEHTEAAVDEFGIAKHSQLKFRQRGGRKVVIPAADSSLEEQTKKTTINSPLINAVAQAFYWAKIIDMSVTASGSEIAQREGLEPSTVNERLRLSLLSPKIVEKILNGTQSEGLTMLWLTRNTFPSNWDRQEQLFSCISRSLMRG